MSSRKKSRRDLIREMAGPGSSAPAATTKDWLELQKLRHTVDRERARISAMGGTVPKEGHEKNPSVLSRVFDVVSRPNYMVANAVHSLTDKSKKGNVLEAAWGGLEGKHKTTFSNVLQDVGMPGGWQRTALGLGLDVGLDPTTYLSLGTSAVAETGEKLAAKGIGIRLAKDAVQAEEALAKAGKSRLVEEALKKAAEHAKRTKVPFNADEVASDAIKEEAFRIAKEKEAEILAKAKPELGIKVLGRETPLKSKLMGQAVENAKTRILENTSLRHISPSTMFPGGLNTRRLQNVGVTGQNIKNELGMLKEEIGKVGLSKKERETALTYLRDGTRHVDPRIQGVIETVRRRLDDIANDKVKMLGDSKFIEKHGPNWVPEVFHKGGYMSMFADPAEAQKLGWSRVTDIADLSAYATADHLKEIGKKQWADEIANTFGIQSRRLTDAEIEAGKKLSHADRALNELVDNGGFTNKVRNPYIPKNTYFDPKVADALNHMEEFFTNKDVLNNFFRGFDGLQRKWKYLATIPNPGYHIRNLLSDSWMNAMNGLMPGDRSYMIAMDSLMPKEVKGLSRPSVNWTIKGANGARHSADEMIAAFDAKGLRSGYYRAEVGGLLPSGSDRVGRTVANAMRGASETREDIGRFANFIHSFERASKQGKSWEKALDEAADKVRTFNYDFNDFTPFETKVMKRVIPFYSWMRKNVPMQLSLLATSPGKIAVAPKGIRAIQELLGTKGEEPMPGLGNILPLWMDEAGAFLTDQGAIGEHGPGVAMLDLPYQDIGRYFEGLDEAMGGRWEKALQPLGAQMSGVSPLIRAPFELSTGKEVFGGGRDIHDISNYLMRQFVPPKRYTTDVFTNPDRGSIKDRLLSTFAPFHETRVQPYQMKSELRRQQDRYDATIGPIKKRAYEEWRKRNGLP